MKKLLVLSFMLLAFAHAKAQEQPPVFNTDVIGEGLNIVQKHPRKPSEYPRTIDTVIPAPQFSYQIASKRVPTDFALDTIKHARVTNEPLQKLYRTYVRAGFGNYTTILGEAYFNQLRSKTWNGGVHLKHFSSSDGLADVAGYSGFSQNSIDLYGKRFLKKHTLSGDLGYDRDVLHFYGSTAAADSFQKNAIVQRFNWIGGGARLQSHYTDSSKINHDIGLRYYNFSDIYQSSENNLRITGSGSRFLNTEKLSLDLGIDYNHNRTASDTAGSTILKFQPAFMAGGKRFRAMIGMAIYADLHSENETRAFFYPQAEFSFDIYKNIVVPYAGITGHLERNSYRSLTQVNPFLLPAAAGQLLNTQNRNVIYAGLKGSLSATVTYNLQASHMQRRNMPLFVNTNEQQDHLHNKFVPVYDTVDVTNLHAEIAFQKMEKIRILAKVDYNIFEPTSQLKAWHNPALRAGFSAAYHVPELKTGLKNKIAARLDIFWISPQYARGTDSLGNFTAIELKGLVDANIALEYRYTKYLSFFAHFNNLAAQRYYRWNAYPTQRFNLLAGLSYSF